MKHFLIIALLVFMFLSACGPLSALPTSLPSGVQSAATATWAETSSPTATFTMTSRFTPSLTPTPTITFTPTITLTPTLTFTPTFDFPKVTVNKANAACLFGPAKAYLWRFDLHQGDTGFVGGRAAASDWLYVKFDHLPDYCWLSPYVVDVVGDVNTVTVQPVRLWITDALYSAPKHVRAVRKGDQVTVTWDSVDMTEDDDRGYFLDVWVCQGGNFVWMPTSFPDQYQTSASFTDEPGCSQPSGGQIYTVEKHGYTSPVDIPWP
jgi:hypothetical protein